MAFKMVKCTSRQVFQEKLKIFIEFVLLLKNLKLSDENTLYINDKHVS